MSTSKLTPEQSSSSFGGAAGGLTFTQSQLGLVLLANRCEPDSTELFLRVTAHDLPVQFYTPLHTSHGPGSGSSISRWAQRRRWGASRQERTNYLDCSRQIVHAQVQ